MPRATLFRPSSNEEIAVIAIDILCYHLSSLSLSPLLTLLPLDFFMSKRKAALCDITRVLICQNRTVALDSRGGTRERYVFTYFERKKNKSLLLKTKLKLPCRRQCSENT